MQITIELNEEDDRSTIETLQEMAKQLRRKKDPKGAHTASKVELAFSRALTEVLPPAESEN